MSKEVEIPWHGRWEYTDKGIIFYDGNGNRRGSLHLNVDYTLCLNGIEAADIQESDPPQRRFGIHDPSQRLGGGVIQACRVRDDGRFENMAQIQIGNTDDATGDDRGQIVFKVRTNQGADEDGMQTAFVATTAYAGSLWTGLANFAGWLWKLANPGDSGAYGGAVGGGTTDTMWANDGMSFTQQQSDGNFVSYVASVPWSKANARAVWSAWHGKID